MNFEFNLHTRIVFGKGTLNQVGKIAKNYGSSVLVITGSTAMKTQGYSEKLLSSLNREDVKAIIFNGVSPNPKAEEVNNAIDLVRKENINLIIGLGGGSAIDVAKATSVGINYSLIEEIIGKEINPDNYIPIIAIPTTAGSGAEVTKGAIITDPKRKIKLGIRGSCLAPKVAIVDPELTYTLPRKVAAETGFDALTHAIEPYITKKANYITDILAEKSINLISEYLETALIGDIDSREKMSLAALYGGINVLNASSCLPHRLQQAMGSVIEISHGAGLAAVYPSWLKIVSPYSQEKIRNIENIFIKKGYKGIFGFMERIGVNYRLRDLGIKKEQIPQFVEKVEGNLENDPIPNINKDLINRIYQESY